MSDEEPSIARILAFMMLDGMAETSTSRDRVVRLSDVGFSNVAVGEILGMSTSSVSTALHAARKAAVKRPPARKAAATRARAQKPAAKRASAKKLRRGAEG
jgi:predicted transcriptional regulator